MTCDIAAFPCKYLRLPLSIGRLTKGDLQPIINKIADSLPWWKVAPLAKSGGLILVKAVLTAIPIYLLIFQDVPKWFIKAVDKWRRQFLCRGCKDLKVGHCMIAWDRVTRPMHLGGLGVHNLEVLSWALRMRWLWLRKVDQSKPWAKLNIQVPKNAEAMFAACVTSTTGDGASTLF